MKKQIFSALFFVLLICTALAQTPAPLNFNAEGEFKVVQFTDTHINLIEKENLEVYDIITKVLEYEKPDLAILTGDIVTQDNPQEAFKKLSQVFSQAKIPWAVVFGNHESEHNLPRKQLAAFLHQLPFCLNDDKGKIAGNSNFVLQVYRKDKKPGALLYCMDSNSYSTLKPKVDGYGWLSFSQIGWYLKNSRDFTRANNGNPLPALAFFHIPLPEYNQEWNNKSQPIYGDENEVVCCPEINTGMFAAMIEAGDVMGTFVGHDHTNDYIGQVAGIALAYGRVSKRMKDPHDPLPGGRVIVLKEGKHEFDTWIRESAGLKVLSCAYPASFLAK